ncbi:MAG: hypothetical protein HYX35_06010 [Proteobacteria bacterium]|nr:hypothetical protein [Pseudomonadota bacterium]
MYKVKKHTEKYGLTEHICFVVPVWGDYHTKIFTEIVLPSYLSKGNIPSCSEFNCCFYIYTDSSSESKIKKSESFKQLLPLCKEIVFKHVDGLPKVSDGIGQTYSALKHIHEEALDLTASLSPALVFLNADTAYANGSFAKIVQLLKKGYRSVELVTLRVNSEEIVPPLQRAKKKGVLDISPIDLVKLGIQHLHKISKQHFWGSNETRLIPDNLYWKVNNQGIIARCSHLHPLMVYPKHKARFNGTIDHDFIEKASIFKDERYIVRDNLEIAGIEISHPYHSQHSAFYSPHSTFDVARFLYTLCTENNKTNLEHSIWLQSVNNINVKEWKKIEKDSDKIITDVKNYFYKDYLCKPFVRTREFYARVLIPMWGRTYIDNFCEISLPSLLAEGNLLYLNEKMDLEIVFLTTKESKQFIIDRLLDLDILNIFSVKFIFIDDLLKLGHYGIVLTAAYARGFQDAGEDQTKIHFFLLNADFILSKNTYKTMYKHIVEGYNAVLISTLRANETTALPILKEIILQNDGILEASGRVLAQITLENLHNTVITNIVNKSWMHHDGVNQLFHQVDETCLIGRFFLLFMGCIKPEKPMRYISGFCDYTFVSDLCPSRNIAIIQDSDEGYMLELQKSTHENDYIKLGAPQTRRVAEILSNWTNKEHRFYGTKNIIIHSENLPINLQPSVSRFDEYMNTIYALIAPQTQPVHHHRFWVGTLRGSQVLLPLATNYGGARFVCKNFLKRFNLIKKMLSPQLYEREMLRQSLEKNLKKFSKKSILIIRSAQSEYDFYINQFINSHPKVDLTLASCEQIILNMVVFPETGFDLIILLVPHSLEKILNTYKDLAKKIDNLTAPGGNVSLFLQSNYHDESIDFVLKNVMNNFIELDLSCCDAELVYGRRRLENIRKLKDTIITFRQKGRTQLLKELQTLEGLKELLNVFWVLLKTSLKIFKQNRNIKHNTVSEDEGISYVTTTTLHLNKNVYATEKKIDENINKNNVVNRKKLIA